MPYEWTKPETDHSVELHLWPYRSLPKRDFVWFMSGTAALMTMPLVAVFGTAVLWGVLPFMLIAIWAVWYAIGRSYKDGELLEALVIEPEHCQLTRHNPRSAPQEWQANPYWVQVQRHETGGPVEDYLTLKGNGREVEIGSFLTAEERRKLYIELKQAFHEVR